MSDIERMAIRDALRAINKISLMKNHGIWPAEADRSEIGEALESYAALQKCYGDGTFASIARWLKEGMCSHECG